MKCRICGTLLTMDAVKRVLCDCGEVDTRARAQQNEDLRLATSVANEALTGGTVCEWCGGDGKEHQVDASFSRVPCDWPCFSCGGTGKGGA